MEGGVGYRGFLDKSKLGIKSNMDKHFIIKIVDKVLFFAKVTHRTARKPLLDLPWGPWRMVFWVFTVRRPQKVLGPNTIMNNAQTLKKFRHISFKVSRKSEDRRWDLNGGKEGQDWLRLWQRRRRRRRWRRRSRRRKRLDWEQGECRRKQEWGDFEEELVGGGEEGGYVTTT